MLSDHEWRTLREVERQFLAEDPEFARSFATRAQHLGHRRLRGHQDLSLVGRACCSACSCWWPVRPAAHWRSPPATALIWLARQHTNDTRSRSPRQPPTGPENDHY